MQVRKEFLNMRKGGKIDLGRLLKDVPVSDIVEVDIKAGADSDENDLVFDWYVEDFTKN